MRRLLVVLCTLIVAAGAVSADVVTLDNETQTTEFTANVSEQANVSVPVGVTFNVTNVSADTASAAQTVSATTVVLADGKKLRIEIAPDDTDFAAPTGGTVTWASSDISWVGTWTNGTANNAAMSALAYAYVKLVDMTTANSGSLSSADLVFTLADNNTVDRSGNHTLATTWKFSSFGL